MTPWRRPAAPPNDACQRPTSKASASPGSDSKTWAGSSSGGSGGGLPSGGFSGDFSISITDPPFYHEIPVVRRVSTTWDGTIWVVRQGDELLEDGPIDVVTASGDYVGTYRTGATKVPDAFGPDGVAAFIEFDDYDVASVVVRRLPAGVR